MTWRFKPPLVRILKGVAAALVMATMTTWASTAQANWGEMAMVSETMGISDSRICIGEGSRGDLGCPSYAPTISPTGRINATAGLTVDSVSLTTTGTTWGYLGSGASYIPNLASNAVSTTNISASTINGIAVSAFGSSPTNVPMFRASASGDQAITASARTKINFPVEQLDNYNSYNPTTSRFTPNVAGNYIFNASISCGNTSTLCYVYIYKNGTAISGNGANNISDGVVQTTAFIYMNGSTDYVEAYAHNSAPLIRGTAFYTVFSGSLLASGNGLVSDTGATALSGLADVTLASPATGQVLTYNGTRWVNATPSATTVISGTTTMVNGWPDAIMCIGPSSQTYMFYFTAQNADGSVSYRYIPNPTATSDLALAFNADGSSKGTVSNAYDCYDKSISQLYVAGKAFNFIGNSGAGGGSALGDRLTSGTLAVTANSSTAIVSLSTAGTTWGYLGSTQSYLPNLTAAQVSATAISTTAVQIASTTTVTACTASNAGTLRYNSTNTALELCTGTSWQVMGVGIPAGTISAFASTTCPTGWSEYTPARGRFLRGIDNGAGNDPSGTRLPGDVQLDLLASHTHSFNRIPNTITGDGTSMYIGGDDTNIGGGVSTAGINATGGAETRPKNVAVTFCQFNGTSNGWNNPLSGGSTVPGGNTGQVQFNSAGAFAGSAGLTWDNATSRLTATNISATSLTVNGVAITGSSSGDRITSGTTAVTANTTGYISLTTGGTTTGYLDTTGRLVVPGVSVTTLNGVSSTTGYFSGRVGMGTLFPSARLHVNNPTDTNSEVARFSSFGNSGSIQGSTFLGLHHWSPPDSANTNTLHPSARIGVIESGVSSYDASLVFQTRNSGSDVLPETRMEIASTGNIGIGRTSPAASLHVSGSVVAQSTGAGQGLWSMSSASVAAQGGLIHSQFGPGESLSGKGGFKEWVVSSGTSANSRYYLGFIPDLANTDTATPELSVLANGNVGINNSAPAYTLDVNGTVRASSALKPGGGSWADSSDERLKTNVRPITGALDKLTRLNGVDFEWKMPKQHHGDTTPGGFVAQNVREVFPEFVKAEDCKGEECTLVNDGKTLTLGLPLKFDAYVVEAMKELKAENDALKSELKAANDNHLRELKAIREEIRAFKEGL